MARASTGGVSRVAARAPHPPPLRLSFPWWRHDLVCSPPWGSGRGGVDVLLAPRRAALALRRGWPLAPPPPRTRSSFPWRCYRVRLPPTPRQWPARRVWSPPLPRRSGSGGVDGLRVDRWPRRCGAGGPSPPPCARHSPGIAITIRCRH